jgi:zinc protease
VFPAKREQVHVFLGHLGVRRSDPDYPALVVMDHVLGAGPGFTNRVAMRLRDELGLAYTVHANIHGSAGVHPGAFTAYIGTSASKVPVAIEGFLREMRRIQDEPVGDAELATAKDYVVGSFALSFQRAARRANYMVTAERFGLPADHLERAPKVYAAITPEDVQRVARAHLHPQACVVAAAGPIREATLRKALASK